jgi:hypothetical protein
LLRSLGNRTPQNGEPARWETARTDPERRVFGVVAYPPNLARDGNTLLIEDISTPGTEAAMDFVDDGAKLAHDEVSRLRFSLVY